MPSANARIPAMHMHDGMWILPHTSPLHVFYNVGFFVWYFTQGESLAPWFRAYLAREFRNYHTLHLLAQEMRRDGQKWLDML
jgi:hypothetical protein